MDRFVDGNVIQKCESIYSSTFVVPVSASIHKESDPNSKKRRETIAVSHSWDFKETIKRSTRFTI